MTVIHPNAVSGINSVTVQSGNSLSIHKSDGSLIRTITGVTGVTTFATVSVGSATTDFAQGGGINIGLGASISNGSGNALTFGTGGDDRVNIDSSGNVLIGNPATYSANGNLHVVGDSNSNGPEVYLQVNNNNTSDNIGALLWGNNTDKSILKIQGISHTSNTTGDLTFHTSSSGTMAERLRITSGGKVGINTTVPNLQYYNDLVVGNNTSGVKGITIRSKSDAQGVLAFSDTDAATSARYAGKISYHHDDNSMRFYTLAGDERLRITSTGLVGINTTAPRCALDLGDNDHTDGASLSNTPADYQLGVHAAQSTTGDIARNIGFISLNANKVTAAINSVDDGTNDTSGLLFATGNGSGLSERLKITGAGRVNIGGAAVSQTRTVNIGSDSEANLAIETHNDATSETANIRFYKSGNTGASPQVVETDDNIAQLVAYGYDGTDYACAAASVKMSVDGAPGSNDMPGKIILSTTADGATSPTERLRIGNAGQIGIAGANYGTDGQVLTSTGASSAPAWEDAGGFWTTLHQGSYTFDSGSDSETITGLGNYDMLRIYMMVNATGNSLSNPFPRMTIGTASGMESDNYQSETRSGEQQGGAGGQTGYWPHTQPSNFGDPGGDYSAGLFTCEMFIANWQGTTYHTIGNFSGGYTSGTNQRLEDYSGSLAHRNKVNYDRIALQMASAGAQNTAYLKITIQGATYS